MPFEWRKTNFNDVQTLHLAGRHVATLQTDLAGSRAVLLPNALGTHPGVSMEFPNAGEARYWILSVLEFLENSG